jgi:putative SOS response-associated peptidase YedK
MCGRYLLTAPRDSLAIWFNFDDGPDLSARYNIASTQSIPIVRMAATDGQRECVLVRRLQAAD